ncbi:hypothetical protein MF672_033920 [Actinomadura sp. ATCC 31491]|uniref:Uncharacterized protein n=1 Tax=Actinomadura luzonensis TaxID=2805427 RepID=A0ABT0G2B8_9ACTN|nr:hypothetical protein [Actinomadura luzonensis]MCK2218756.1 hypothetical protein [Actinomadura luzonensis]
MNTLTGEGLTGARVVVDGSNSPSFEREAMLEFFGTSTRNLLAAEATGEDTLIPPASPDADNALRPRHPACQSPTS